MSKQADILPTAFFFKGEDRLWKFIIYQKDGVTRQDITGWTLDYSMRDGATHPVAVVSKATGGAGITATNQTQGEGQVAINRLDTARLSAGKYWHHLRRTNPGSDAHELHGDVYLLAGGS